MTEEEKLYAKIGVLDECKDCLEDEYLSDYNANRMASVINKLIKKHGEGDGLSGALYKYAGYLQAKHKYLDIKDEEGE